MNYRALNKDSKDVEIVKCVNISSLDSVTHSVKIRPAKPHSSLLTHVYMNTNISNIFYISAFVIYITYIHYTIY